MSDSQFARGAKVRSPKAPAEPLSLDDLVKVVAVAADAACRNKVGKLQLVAAVMHAYDTAEAYYATGAAP